MSAPTAVRPPSAPPVTDPGRDGEATRPLTVPGVLGPTVAVWVAVMLSALCLGPLFVESGWIGPTLLVVTSVVVVGGVATWLRVPMVLIPLVSAVAMFAALVLRFVDDAPWGFLPTPYAMDQLRDVMAEGTNDIQRFAPPIPVTDGLSAVTALGIGSVALVVLVLQLVLRLPALAGLPLVAMYVVPSSVLSGSAPWWAFVLVVTGWLLLLASDERLTLIGWGRLLRRRSDRVGGTRALSGLAGSAFRLGVVAVALALALPVVIPGLTDAVLGRSVSGTGGEGQGSGGGDVSSIGIDPIVSLQRNLLNNPDVTVLRYSTTDPNPGYLRAVVLESFDGDSWKPRAFAADKGANPLSEGVANLSGLPDSVARTDHQYELSADKLESRYLPLPEHALTVGLQGDWYVDQTTDTVFSADDATTTKGRTWTVDAVHLAPTPTQLRAAPALTGLDRARVQGSIAVPDSLAQTAREVTRGTPTDFDAARALETWFHENFTYSTQGVRPDSSASYLEQFLRDRTGYCEQFSATMALMAISLGIPARVVVGYTAGSPVTGQPGVYRVSGKNAHAWPELFFSGIGWVRFEPTPSTGGGGISQPVYTGSQADQPDPTASATAPGSVGNRRDQDIVRSANDRVLTGDLLSATSVSSDTWRARALAGVVAVLAVVALVPATRRWLRRRRRLAATRDPEAAWAELRDTVLDLGGSWSDARTPRQSVVALVAEQHLSGAVAEAAVRLGRAVERSRYATTPADLALVADDLSTVRRALVHRADRGARVRARLVPASLRTSPALD